MYVKLTKIDGSPVWINASYVVTVEPSRMGGSLVVPIGDGLDYDVRESPEEVLSLVASAVAPAVVPVPSPRALAKATTRKKKSAATTIVAAKAPAAPVPAAKAAEPMKATEPAAEEEAPKKKRKAKAKAAEESASEPAVAPEAAAADPESAAPEATEATDAAPEATPESAPAAESAEADVDVLSIGPAKSELPAQEAQADQDVVTPFVMEIEKPKFVFPEEYIARLRKLAPGSIRKLNNTLRTQFKIDNPTPIMLYLIDRRVIALDKDHIVWLQPDAGSIPENMANLVLG